MMDRKRFTVEVRERAQVPASDFSEQAIVICLRLIADNLSVAGTEEFALAMPDEWRADIGRALAKIEHTPKEIIDLLTVQAGIDAAAADQIFFAVLVQLWQALPEPTMQKIIRQCPARLAHALRGARPGQKRGSF